MSNSFLSTIPPDRDARMARVRLALDGLSVGDAFGQRFFSVSSLEAVVAQRSLPAPPPWHYTDDTEMALAIAEVLSWRGHIDQDELARVFGRRYLANPLRGYGGGAHGILQALGAGQPWRETARAVFAGTGSLGNSAAMRVAPVGAWFSDDLGRAAAEGRASAEVTHAHPEGQAGGIAIAVAAAWAAQRRERPSPSPVAELFDVVLDHTPPGETRRGIEHARLLSLDLSVATAASLLGNGSQVTAPDTVPFTLWCSARHLDDYESALWTTVSARGDLDTTCAIVGGVVALACGPQALPAAWLAAREPLALRS